LDTFEIGDSGKPKLSHIAARQEVRGLINALQLPSRQAASGAEGDSMGVAQ